MTGKDGAYGRMKGYLFEEMDTAAYNKANEAVGRRLVKRSDPRAPAYDATRFITEHRQPAASQCLAAMRDQARH